MEVSLKNKTILCCAKRGSGKSNIIRWLIQAEEHNFKKVYLISPTERVNKFYSEFIDEDCIFDEYSERWVEKLIETMTEENTGKTGDKLSNVLVILDDCIADLNMHSSKTLKILFARGRHAGIGIVITTQYINAVSPLIRTNSDYILCGQMNRASLQLLCDEYMTATMERNEFIKMYATATSNYGFLLVKNQSVEDNADHNQTYGIIKCPLELVS
jgi:hypothetical protein